MTGFAIHEATSPRAPASRPWQLGRVPRKILLVVHILAGGSWIGIDVIIGVLVFTGRFSDDTATRGAAYQGLNLFVGAPLLTAGLLSMASGVLLGLGTKYALLRYWWVAVKLAINIVLCVLVPVLLLPELATLGEYGRALSAGSVPDRDLSNLYFPPTVSLTALSLATVLSVFKPWGRIRRNGGARAGCGRTGRAHE